MKVLKCIILIYLVIITTAYADDVCDAKNLQLYMYGNFAFQIPSCLAQNIEDDNIVYRYKNGNNKSFIMVTGMNNLSSQDIYNNLSAIAEKLAYLRRETIVINKHKATIISFKSLIEENTSYEARTYIFDDLDIRFITHENNHDHVIFLDIVKSIRGVK